MLHTKKSKNEINNIVNQILLEYSGYRVFKYPYQITSDSSEYRAVYSQDYERYSKLMNFLPNIEPKSRVLEVGTGIGYLAVMLKRIFNYDVTTIEHPSRESLKNRDFLNRIAKEGIQIKAVNILSDMDIDKNIYDMVVFSEVLEHISPTPDMIKKVFDNLTGIVKQNGYIVVTTPNVGTLESRLRALRGVSIQPFPLQDMTDDTYEHVRIYSAGEIKRILEIYHFEIIKIGYSNYIKGKLVSDLKRIILSKIATVMSANIMISARKTK